jgi:hypothetical protein
MVACAGREADLKTVARELADEGRALGSPRFEREAALFVALAERELSPAALEPLAAAEDVAPVAARLAQALLGGAPALDEVDRRVLQAIAAADLIGTVTSARADDAPGASWRPGWGLDDRRRSVWLPDGRAIDLGARAMLWRVLDVMASRGGAATKEELMLSAWEEKEYHPLRHDTRIHVAVRKLRALIEDQPDRPERLVTAEDGYRLAGQVRRAR